MSFLDQSLETVSTLPNEIARNLYLIGELDEGSNAELAKLKELQALYLDLVRTKAQETGEKHTAEEVLDAESAKLEELEHKPPRQREQMLQTAEEKVAIAEQSFCLVDRRIRQLEELMFQCEDQLRQHGLFDVSRVDRGTPLMSGEVVTDRMKPEYQYQFHRGDYSEEAYQDSPVHYGGGGGGGAAAASWQGPSMEPSEAAAAAKAPSATMPPPPPSPMDLIPTDPAQQFCYCKRGQFGDMIGCDNDDCPIGHGWFHLSCVGVDHVPKGDWYCPTCARAMGIHGMPGTIPRGYEPESG